MAKSKETIIEELEELGVEYDEESSAKELAKVLKEAQNDEEKEDEDEEDEEDDDEEDEDESEDEDEDEDGDEGDQNPAPKVKVKAGKRKYSGLSVYDAKGSFVRVYSAEVHGKGFKKLAAQFAGKIGGKAVRDGRKE